MLTFVGAGNDVKGVVSEQHQRLCKLVSKEPSLPLKEESGSAWLARAGGGGVRLFDIPCAYLHGSGLLVDVVVV